MHEAIIPHPWQQNGTVRHLHKWLGVRKLERPEPYIYDGQEYTFDFYHRKSHKLIKILNHMDESEVARYKALPVGNEIVVIIDTAGICDGRAGLNELSALFPFSIKTGAVLRYNREICDAKLCSDLQNFFSDEPVTIGERSMSASGFFDN
jgi:hypothetical protein